MRSKRSYAMKLMPGQRRALEIFYKHGLFGNIMMIEANKGYSQHNGYSPNDFTQARVSRTESRRHAAEELCIWHETGGT
eukprot:6752627-Lingulodinium_polyedra.AAC.1